MPITDWPWAIVLCKYNDVPETPQDPKFYEELYTISGMGGMCDYWSTVSFSTLNLTGSQVFGWFTMSHASSDIEKLRFPQDRSVLIQWGIDTANANGINLSNFRSVLIVQNAGPDHGAAGNGVVIVHRDPGLCEYGFIAHEMGHGFGLPHSNSANPDMVYGDGWDLMSFATSTFQFPIQFKGANGAATVGLNARNLEALNAIPAGRLWIQEGADFSADVTLDPLNQTPMGNLGHLVAKILSTSTRPHRSDNSTYTIELHKKAGWDRAIPEDAVIVHQVRIDGLSYLQPTRGSYFRAGQTFVTPDPKVFIHVVSIGAAARVRVWDAPEGSLRKEDSKPEVYLIQGGQKRWVTSPQVLSALGKNFADVRGVPDGGLATLPAGPDVHMLRTNVSPHPIPLNQRVTITVHTENVATSAAVNGDVKVDNVVIGKTNVPITHVFKTKRRVISVRPPEIEIILPFGVVVAPGFPDSPIDFGFPEP